MRTDGGSTAMALEAPTFHALMVIRVTSVCLGAAYAGCGACIADVLGRGLGLGALPVWVLAAWRVLLSWCCWRWCNTLQRAGLPGSTVWLLHVGFCYLD